MENEPNYEQRLLKNVPLEEIIPFEDNTREHGHKSIASIGGSIKKFGYTSPIEVDEKMVILSGHGRYFTLKKSGKKVAPSVIQIIGMPEEDKIIYRDAHNATAEASTWNREKRQIMVDSITRQRELAKLEPIDWKVLNINLDPTDEVDKAFNKHNDDNCEYPIIPKFNEQYNSVTIICANETDFFYLSTKLGLGKAKTYFKSEKIGQQRAVMFDKVKHVFSAAEDDQK